MGPLEPEKHVQVTMQSITTCCIPVKVCDPCIEAFGALQPQKEDRRGKRLCQKCLLDATALRGLGLSEPRVVKLWAVHHKSSDMVGVGIAKAQVVK
jgi:hypothetical protein